MSTRLTIAGAVSVTIVCLSPATGLPDWTIAEPESQQTYHTGISFDPSGAAGEQNGSYFVLFRVYDGQGIVASGTEENFTDNWIVHDVSAPSGGYSCGGKTGRVYELVSGVYQQRAAVGFTTEDSGCM